MSLFNPDQAERLKYNNLARDYAKLESDHNQLKIDFNKLNEDYVKMVESTHKVLQDNKKLEAKNDELSNFDGLEEFQKDADKSTKIFVDKIKLERDRADKYGKQNNEQLDTIEKLRREVRGLKHDNKRLRDDNVEIKRNADIRINKYMEQFKEPPEPESEPEPEPESELIEVDNGVEEPEAPEDFTCKVCGHEAKTLYYLKMHVERSKDADHQAYLEEDF